MKIPSIKLRQKALLKKIASVEAVEYNPEKIELLKNIVKTPDEVLFDVLKELGPKLKRMGSKIDFSHPDVRNIYYSLSDKKSIGLTNKYGKLRFNDCERVITHLNSLYLKGDKPSFALQSVMKSVLAELKQFFGPNISRSIDDPCVSGQFIRFLSNRQERDTARKFKKIQNIVSYKKVSCPNKFDEYHLMNNPYANQIDLGFKTIDGLKKFGLEHIILRSKEQVKSLLLRAESENYFGFNRINLMMAVNTLAKMCHYTFNVKLGCFQNKGKIPFKPVLKPLHESNVSSQMAKLIDVLEAYPAANHKCLFDHYWILSNQIDSIAVLLGERDGIMYFISYWE